MSVHQDGASYHWAFRDSYLYLFRTKVAFFCLGIEYEDVLALQAICSPGFAVNTAEFFCDREQRKFSLNEMLGDFLKQFQLEQFFDNSSLLLDYYSYNLALLPERFDTLDEMKKLSFNLHQMIPLDFDMDDHSEQDVHYVFAVRDCTHNSYRWGCCVTSQTISYVVADSQMDFDSEWAAQSEDGLPVVILSLYQKYTCLRFNQLIADTTNKKSAKTLKALKRLMLNFKAFGTVAPANLSRWDNVRRIYFYLMDVNGVSQALTDIVDKLNILTSQQEALE